MNYPFKRMVLSFIVFFFFLSISSINAQTYDGIYGNEQVSLHLKETTEGIEGLFVDSDGSYYEAMFVEDQDGLIGILGDYYAIIPFETEVMTLVIMPKDSNDEPLWDDALEFEMEYISPLETEAQPADYSQILWAPIKRFGTDFYPSYVLATSTWSKEIYNDKEEHNYSYRGDGNGYFGIQIQKVPIGSIVRVEIEGEPIAKKSSYTITVTSDGMTEIFPQMEYDFDALRNIEQAKAVNFKFSIYLNDQLLGETKEVIWTRSVNDAIFWGEDHHGGYHSLPFIFAAYVNENEPMLDVVLGEMLDDKIVNSWNGYQGDKNNVLKQVFAMWYHFQKKGFKYSSITTQSGSDEKSKGQVVRFVKDALNTSQANCVDGTVLFASFLYKIGIDVSIILVPEHAYLAFSLTEDGKELKCLETTMLGNLDIENVGGQSGTNANLEGQSEEMQKSFNWFLAAMDYATNEFETKAIPGINNKDPRYMMINVKDARRRKVRPIR